MSSKGLAIFRGLGAWTAWIQVHLGLLACGGEVVVLTEDGSSYVWEQVRWPLKSRKGALLVASLLPTSCEVLAQAFPFQKAAAKDKDEQTSQTRCFPRGPLAMVTSVALASWLKKTGPVNGSLALATWAAEAPKCVEITVGGRSSALSRVWIVSSAGALGLISVVLVPYVWCRHEHSERKVLPEGGGGGTAGVAGADLRASSKEDVRRSKPDMASAERHLVSSSCTVGGRWLNPLCTNIDGFSEIGGSGLEMYFKTLRSLGILFATMAALTFPTTAFCLQGTFAPDNGQVLARASIGNLGLLADTKLLDPLLRLVRAGCDGAELSELTPIFAWLDLSCMIVLFLYLVRFRFIEIPRQAKLDDLESVSVQDFSVVIDNLPPRIEYQAEDYESLLKSHLEERMKALQGSGKPEPVAPAVADITLVRDFSGRLETLKARGRTLQSIDVAKAYGKDQAIFKAEKKLAKLDRRLQVHLAPDSELPVIRAYVILNRTTDKNCLLEDYRLDNFALLRWFQPASKRFHGAALQIREAPQPSDLLWENQDTPFRSRLLRQLCVVVTFVLILAFSVVLIYVATVVGKREAGSQLSYIGNEQCDPQRMYSSAPSDGHVCIVSVASNWTMDFAVSRGGSMLNCWCESQGYSKLVESAALVSACEPWFLNAARGIGIMQAASVFVIVINMVLQMALRAMAQFERPLSLTALYKSMMEKIFIAQTLNTGFVLFVVNMHGPQSLRDVMRAIPLIGSALFAGPFDDLTRAWYVDVGATITTNMLINMVVPPAITILNIFKTWLMRRFKRGRVKHHSELITLYTNPEFDIKVKYAQMLTTVFVSLTYSAGMPLLYLFAFGYMCSMYWADKVSLLWCSKRPPSYDALLPKEASEKLLYAVALHCFFAVLMYGQACVFPSNPAGGDIGKLLEEKGAAVLSEHLQGWWPRLTRESTWMFVAFFCLMLAIWVLWWLAWAFHETFGGLVRLLWQFCRPSVKKVFVEDTGEASKPADSVEQKLGKTVDIAETMTWPEAKAIIDRCSPPSSYSMEDHPDMLEIAHLMKAEYNRPGETTPQGAELPLPEHGGQSFDKAMVS